jgi:hypothetical protein
MLTNRLSGILVAGRAGARGGIDSIRIFIFKGCGTRFTWETGFSRSHTILNGVALRDPLTGLRALRWEILKGWTPKSKGFDIQVELNHRVERQGFEIEEIEIPYRQRLGEKKLKLRHGLSIAGRIVLESLSVHA